MGTDSLLSWTTPQVQGLLQKSGRSDVDIEIVFPVDPRAITTSKQLTSGASNGSNGTASPVSVQLPGGLAVLPGPALGEGCSLEGGCASCPYMRMNTLAALSAVCQSFGTRAGEAALEAFKPRPYLEKMPNGQTVAQAGCEPILHMRGFQQTKELPPALVQDILTRNSAAA